MKEIQEYIIARWFIPGYPYEFEDVLGRIPSSNRPLEQNASDRLVENIVYEHKYSENGEHTIFLSVNIPDITKDGIRAVKMENGWGVLPNKDGSILVVRPRDLSTLWNMPSKKKVA